MSDDLIFYHNPMSRGRIAHWMLEETGAKYRTEILQFDRGDHKKPEYLAINPMGKVPAIVHRGAVVTECAAICTYLADAFPDAGLAPKLDDLAGRATYLRWLFFAAGCVEPAVTDHAFKRPAVDRPGALGYGSYEAVLGALEKAIGDGPFILGERFSAADVYVGSQIGWGLMMKSIEARPAFVAYVQRLHERPAAKRANEQDDKLLAELKAAEAPKA